MCGCCRGSGSAGRDSEARIAPSRAVENFRHTDVDPKVQPYSQALQIFPSPFHRRPPSPADVMVVWGSCRRMEGESAVISVSEMITRQVPRGGAAANNAQQHSGSPSDPPFAFRRQTAISSPAAGRTARVSPENLRVRDPTKLLPPQAHMPKNRQSQALHPTNNGPYCAIVPASRP